ncbi:hypothetical protein T06_13768 [Trichinella sp. T6]|nr:hypothetical protein T06_13768 [Trichinella sp. T6]
MFILFGLFGIWYWSSVNFPIETQCFYPRTASN